MTFFTEANCVGTYRKKYSIPVDIIEKFNTSELALLGVKYFSSIYGSVNFSAASNSFCRSTHEKSNTRRHGIVIFIYPRLYTVLQITTIIPSGNTASPHCSSLTGLRCCWGLDWYLWLTPLMSTAMSLLCYEAACSYVAMSLLCYEDIYSFQFGKNNIFIYEFFIIRIHLRMIYFSLKKIHYYFQHNCF